MNIGCIAQMYTLYNASAVLKNHLHMSLSSHKQTNIMQNKCTQKFHEM